MGKSQRPPYDGSPPNRPRPPRPDPEESRRLAQLAEEAIGAFREENPEAHRDLVRAFEGQSADVALLGHGRMHVAVRDGEVKLDPDRAVGPDSTGRGAIAPETVVEIVEGRLTPLEAFFKGDLIARAHSDDLHKVYDFMVRYSDTAMRSKRLQELLKRFREQYDV